MLETSASKTAHDLSQPDDGATLDLSGAGVPVFDLDELVHEVRGPLATASVALESLDDPRAVEVLEASLHHLQDLLRSLTPGKDGPTTVMTHLPTAVMIADPHRRVVLDLSVGSDDRVCCAPVRFRQLIVNLVGNALKFSDPSSPVTVRAWKDAGQVLITIADNGQGFSAEDADLVFERGIRGDDHDAVPGDGLGLAIVRRLARSCRGDARLVSTSRDGTVFEVSLPLVG